MGADLFPKSNVDLAKERFNVNVFRLCTFLLWVIGISLLVSVLYLLYQYVMVERTKFEKDQIISNIVTFLFGVLASTVVSLIIALRRR